MDYKYSCINTKCNAPAKRKDSLCTKCFNNHESMNEINMLDKSYKHKCIRCHHNALINKFLCDSCYKKCLCSTPNCKNQTNIKFRKRYCDQCITKRKNEEQFKLHTCPKCDNKVTKKYMLCRICFFKGKCISNECNNKVTINANHRERLCSQCVTDKFGCHKCKSLNDICNYFYVNNLRFNFCKKCFHDYKIKCMNYNCKEKISNEFCGKCYDLIFNVNVNVKINANVNVNNKKRKHDESNISNKKTLLELNKSFLEIDFDPYGSIDSSEHVDLPRTPEIFYVVNDNKSNYE
jgi:hypothetical protein